MFSSRPWKEDASLGIAVWRTDPPGGVVRILRSREIDTKIADFMLNEALQTYVASGEAPWSVVFDCSRATGYTSEARTKLTDWALVNGKKKLAVGVIVLPDSAPGLLKMGVSVAAAMLRATGTVLHIAPGLTEATMLAKVRER
jgi:hypothetical protein